MGKLSGTKRSVAVKFYEQLKSLIRSQGSIFLEIGRLLLIIRDERYYEHLGDYPTWISFLNDGGVGLGHSAVYAYIAIYESYVMRFGFAPDELSDIPWDKLHMALPLVRRASNKEEALEAVEKARMLSRSDIRVEVGEVVSGREQKTKVIKVFRCDDCGNYRIDSDIKICKCKK